MTFYGKCLQAEPGFTPFSAGPPEMPAVAKTAPDRILHAELASGPVVLMASDTLPGMPFRQGNNFSISISCESQPEMERLFAAFSENGKVTMLIARRILGRPLRHAHGSIRHQLDVQFPCARSARLITQA
jgi:PhnB protein